MTNTQSPFGAARGVAFPTLPTGDVVASFKSYAEAQAAVDKLAETDDFPVQSASIVGSDMKSVERVTGRLSWGRAAGAGAASGLWIGLLFGLLISVFGGANDSYFAELLGAVLIGAAFGMVFGLISYALTRRRRDFSSVMQVVASSYSIVVGGESANRARNILGTAGGGTTETTTIEDAGLDEQPLGPGSGGPGAAA
ncbi:general stress protein [Amnibacterium endophyticum]|uniref:General stress protein n=1 Tax=Amnibacterium endophyticum TaxID=2109337 RepID=A0ABW4LDI2_9MICO